MSFQAEVGGDSSTSEVVPTPSAASTASSIANGIESVDFGTRFVAFMIDACLLFSLQWIVVMVLSRQLQAAGMTATSPCGPENELLCEGPNGLLWALLFVVIIVSTFGYHVWFEGVVGATPGKRLMGLAVRRSASGGSSLAETADPSPIGLVSGLVRSGVRQSPWLWCFLFLGASPIAIDLPAVIWFLLLAASVSPLISAAVSATGQGLHDRAAGSVVVRRAPVFQKEF